MIIYELVDGLWQALNTGPVTPPDPPADIGGYGSGGYGATSYGS